MKIEDIIPDFTKLSTEQLQALVRDTRRSRTTAKPVTLSKRPTKESSQAKDSVDKLVGKLSAKEMAALKKLFQV